MAGDVIGLGRMAGDTEVMPCCFPLTRDQSINLPVEQLTLLGHMARDHGRLHDSDTWASPDMDAEVVNTGVTRLCQGRDGGGGHGTL